MSRITWRGKAKSISKANLRVMRNGGRDIRE